MNKRFLIPTFFVLLAGCKTTHPTASGEKGVRIFDQRPCQANLKAENGTEMIFRFKVKWEHGYRAYPLELQVITPNGSLAKNIEVKLTSKSRDSDPDLAKMTETLNLRPTYDSASRKYLDDVEQGLVLLYDNDGIQSTLVQTVEAKVDGKPLIDPIGHKEQFTMSLLEAAKAQRCM